MPSQQESGLQKQRSSMGWGLLAGIALKRLVRVAIEIVGHPEAIQHQHYERPATLLRLIVEDFFAADLNDEALHLCRQLLRRPRLSEDVVAALASTLLKCGHLRSAELFFRVGLRRYPSSPGLLCGLGVLRFLQGRREEALRRFEAALAIRPDYAEALSNMGNIFLTLGDVQEAVRCYQSALRSDPSQLDALSNLGNALQQTGQLEDAIRVYQQVLRLRPGFVPALSNLGIAYQRMGLAEQAIGVYNAALQADAAFPDAWSNLGLSLQSISRHCDALLAFEKALLLSPDDSRYRCNLANCHLELGRLDEALHHYRAALRIDPSSLDCQLSFAIALLLHSNCCDGWQLYEARLTDAVVSGLDPGRSLCPERWKGVPGALPARLFLACEQGLGDTIHFCRYAKFLAQQGVHVMLRVQPQLLPVLKSSNLGVHLVEPDEPLCGECDAWSPLLSLPLLLGVSAHSPLLNSPYLSVAEEVMAEWAGAFAAASLPVVAINWQGNPAAEVNNLKGRSIPLQDFEILADRAAVEFVAVQHGEGYGQLDQISFRDRFVTFQDKVGPCLGFEDAAAIVANSLLLITSDTAIAHLSAAAGFETWLLLHAVPDWRWGLSGDSTFWYPNVRIFRQVQRGDWKSVMADVAEALVQRVTLADAS